MNDSGNSASLWSSIPCLSHPVPPLPTQVSEMSHREQRWLGNGGFEVRDLTTDTFSCGDGNWDNVQSKPLLSSDVSYSYQGKRKQNKVTKTFIFEKTSAARYIGPIVLVESNHHFGIGAKGMAPGEGNI